MCPNGFSVPEREAPYARRVGERRRETVEQAASWLDTSPSLEELSARYPDDWAAVSARLEATAGAGSQGLHDVIAEFAASPHAGRDRQLPRDVRISQLVRRRMLQLALRSISDRRESGVRDGAIRFGLLDGLLLQRTLFSHDLVRKPVNLALYRMVWRLARQRDRLMPLVRPRGIYCFYSRRLIRELAAIIGERDALEIAAGDGTLSRFLTDAGAKVRATDDYSWTGSISYPATVEKADARTALRQHAPRVVICCWPPAGNPFERTVFATPSVETYIVIASPDEREAGGRGELPHADRIRHGGQRRARQARLARGAQPGPRLHPSGSRE